MKKIILFLFSFSPVLNCFASPDHDVKNHPTSSQETTNYFYFPSIQEAWQSIQNSAKKIEDSINSTNLAPIHQWQEKLSGGLTYLKTNSSQVLGDQAKRLEAALKQADEVAQNLHKAADEKLVDPAKREFEKLKKALKLVEAQYPKESLHSTNLSTHSISNQELSNLSLSVQTSPANLEMGKEARVFLRLKKSDGSPVTFDDLKEVHTKKIHLLIIDSSLTDYHHKHPTATTNSGEYEFSFTPNKVGSYRIWADIVPKQTDQQEYLISDLPAETKGEPITDRKPNLVAKIDDLTLTLSFDKTPLSVGQPALGQLRITDKTGKVFSQLEPVMGAYAHIVGFSEDYHTIAHVHPMGPEPSTASDRGTGELTFHLVPKKGGLIRLFVQVQIKGEEKFAAFTIFAPAQSD